VVIPGSHKSNLPHPTFRKDYREKMKDPPELEVGAVPVYLKAGDAILFVDCVSHGGGSGGCCSGGRTLVYRYGPYWGQTRLGYQYSPELIARLTPERAKILQPIPPRRPPQD